MIDPMPVLRLEVDRLKYTVQHALSKYEAEFNEALKAALEREVTPENISKIIDREVARLMPEVVSDALRSFFTYQLGQNVVKEAVEQRLRQLLDKADRD